ncbi:MAG: hypothetical protein LBG58_11695 [Planctomycetaceae bacterium]|jgi:hypothetical protein|nr:hypothetical protein [Planctomycetaceae bacterium]
MFLAGSVVWVQKDGILCELPIQHVRVDDLIFTEKCRFCRVVETHAQAVYHGLLMSDTGWKIWCFYNTSFFGYEKAGGEPKDVLAKDMVHGTKYWKCYSTFYPDSDVRFERVIDWRPCYNKFPKNGQFQLLYRNAYSVTVEEDHSFFVNGIAVFDNTFNKEFIE